MGGSRVQKRSTVPSGSYIIGSSRDEVLEAYLGTCVGVTVCDPRNNVGGLIHILLPEPTGGAGLGKSENYAITGLPKFIKELCEKGADKKELQATIAGGALIGPFSEMDINLDIGGRSTEIVERILHKEGIRINQSETGGYFSCRLSLDLRTWKSHIEPIDIPTETSGDKDLKGPSPEELDVAIRGVRPIIQVSLKIIRMIQDDAYSMGDLAKEIKQDQVISAKILKLCNSSFFYIGRKIESIDKALIFLGEKQLLKLVLSASFQDFFTSELRGYSLSKGGLFNHAFGTAVICRTLAELTGKVSDDLAYTAGLLHDIGKVVLDQYMDTAYSLFYRRTQVDGEELIKVEREVFGIDHTEAGGRLAEQWALPESLIEVISHHHYPEMALKEHTELTLLVFFANLLMSRFLTGQELERSKGDSIPARLQRIGLTVEDIPSIIEKIPVELFRLPSSGPE